SWIFIAPAQRISAQLPPAVAGAFLLFCYGRGPQQRRIDLDPYCAAVNKNSPARLRRGPKPSRAGTGRHARRAQYRRRRARRDTAPGIARRIARGEGRTDWKRVKAMKQSEVERLADEEEGKPPKGWEKKVVLGIPAAKKD